ncbi:hypothetical protein [Mesorhizobium sp. B2-4-19]|uniref:hypothetical protein n=1 Tax=Mesorhizobium sp. B2-4-19 TaxID=2589930 RepID=UPI0015E290A6|nr:hypothetical protein [Mesorhizobium sp. B2-4-19]
MVHVIPLSIAQRRLDTGNAPQYPQGSPIGGAMQGFGDHLSAAAERYQQMKDQQQAFDAELARRRFNGQIAQAEDEVTANGPADGAGLHEAMYGQVDPYTGRVVKTGLFDKLFAAALPGMPESQRAAFAGQKETMRHTGGRRMAARQLQRRKDYEQAQWAEVQRAELDAIAQISPNDTVAFDAARRRGLDVLDKMGLDPQGKSQTEAAWRESTAKTRIEALIAGNPKRALDLLGLTASANGKGNRPEQGIDGTGSVAGTDSSNASTDKGDRARRLTPNERIGQAFQDNFPIDNLLAELSPASYDDVVRKARTADAASLINTHADLDIASQNARAAITNMTPYSGSRHDDTEFASVFGAEEGGKRSRTFNWRADVSPYLADMRVMPTSQVDASIFAEKPLPNRFSQKQDPELYRMDQARYEKDQERYELNADAAAFIIQQRQVDPAAYARKVIPSVDKGFKNLSTSQDLQAAVALSFAAQRQLGIAKPQPLPRSDAEGLIRAWSDASDPKEAERKALEAINDPKQRKALATQLDDVKATQSETPAALEAEGLNKDMEAKRFAKAIYLSPSDILRLKKTLMTEWIVSDGDIEAKGVIDAILNRLASHRWGYSIESVVNSKDQYSDVNGPVSREQHNRSNVDQLSIYDPRFDRASKLVDEYLVMRAAGAPSVVEDHLNYGDPKTSSPKNRVWLEALDGPILGRHHHGTEPAFQKYRPGEFSINLPEDYYPTER